MEQCLTLKDTGSPPLSRKIWGRGLFSYSVLIFRALVEQCPALKEYAASPWAPGAFSQVNEEDGMAWCAHTYSHTHAHTHTHTHTPHIHNTYAHTHTHNDMLTQTLNNMLTLTCLRIIWSTVCCSRTSVFFLYYFGQRLQRGWPSARSFGCTSAGWSLPARNQLKGSDTEDTD